MGLAAKYGLDGVQCGSSAIKESLYGCVLSRRCSFRFVCLSSLVMHIILYCVRVYVMYGILLFLYLLIIIVCILCTAFVA